MILIVLFLYQYQHPVRENIYPQLDSNLTEKHTDIYLLYQCIHPVKNKRPLRFVVLKGVFYILLALIGNSQVECNGVA